MSQNRPGEDEPPALEVDDVYDIMHSPACREILWILVDGPLHVGPLTTRIGISQSATSKALAFLNKLGVVDDEQEQTRHYYSLTGRISIGMRGSTRCLTFKTRRGPHRIAEPTPTRVVIPPGSDRNQTQQRPPPNPHS